MAYRLAAALYRRALDEIEPARWETVVAHELAHIKRRDHWTACLVLAASCAWWWNPVLWWARRHIADYAEMACDAWVLWALPERGREYADTLLKFVEAHSATPAVVPDPMPCMSSERAQAFKQRLTAILRGPSPSRLGVAGVICLAALAAVVLPVFSQQTGGQVEPPQAPEAPATPVSPPPASEPVAAPVIPPPALESNAESGSALENLELRLKEEPVLPQRALSGNEAQPASDPFNVGTPSEALKKALDAPVSLDFADFHVATIAEFIAATYDMNIVMDWRVVEPRRTKPPAAPGQATDTAERGAPSSSAGLNTASAPGNRHTASVHGYDRRQPDMPPGGYETDGMVVYVKLSNIPLREALDALLRPLNLTFVTYPNVVFITSQEKAIEDSRLPRPGLPPYAALGEVLSAPISIEFNDAHISEIIEFLSETYDLNFMIDWRVVPRPKAAAPSDAQKVSAGRVPFIQMTGVPMGEALDVLFRSINLTFRPERNYIWVSSFDVIFSGPPGGPATSAGGGIGFPGGG